MRTRWALAALVLGTALRFYYAWDAGDLTDDARYRYLEIARHLRAGEGYAIEGHATAQAMPLWPLVLSVLPEGMKPNYLAAALSALALPLAWLVARRLGGARLALLVLALMAVDLDQARLGGRVLTEPLFTVLLLLFAVAWVAERPAWAAVPLGLATLTRPEAFLVPLAMALFTREWKRPLILLAGVVIAVAPWAVRNTRVFGGFVPFTTTGGITLNAGMNETEAELPFRKKGQGRGKRFRHALVMAKERTEVSDDRELGRQAIRYAWEHPGAALELTAAKAMLLWTPVQRKGNSAVYAVAVLLAWWAIVRGVRFRTPLVGPLLAVMTFVSLVFIAIPRYRAPYHPYVFMLAAAVLVRRTKRTRSLSG